MRQTRKLLTALLALTLLAGLIAVPASAAGEYSFSDITDPQVAEAAETLRVMGVVDGVGDSAFNPGGQLTRAQFCKMAILLTGRGSEVAAYETRTIFTDVAYNHWARGYVNLAAQSSEGQQALMLGTGDGSFAPDAVITYQQAVTVLLRILGYSAEIQTNWPYSALGLATSQGLDAGLGSVSGGGSITRAQAALLFTNTLLAHPKDSQSIYASTLGSSSMEGAILLSLDAPTADGGVGTRFSKLETPVRAAHNTPHTFFLGKRGTVVLDDQGLLLAFIPERGASARTIVLQAATATAVTAADGSKYPVPSSAKVLWDGAEHTYGEIFPGINRPGLTVTVYYTASGAVDYLYVGGSGSALSGSTMVAQKDGTGAFDDITGGSRTCRVLKNGAEASQADIKKYDVGLYASGSDTLYVTDFRLSGLLQDASPNPYAPTKITFFNREFDVLSCAVADFESVKVGTVVTVLFAPDGKVAGVKPTSAVSSNAMGVVAAADGSTVTVEFINSPLPTDENGRSTLTASLSSGADASSYRGSVLMVSGGSRKENGVDVPVLYLSRHSGAGGGELRISARTVGGTALADNAAVYEKVGNSAITAISLADIPLGTVPASKVTYVHKNSAGKVDVLVLDDVTGDRYTYGLVKVTQEPTDYSEAFGEIKNNVTTVTFDNETAETCQVQVLGSFPYPGTFGGVVASLADAHGTKYASAAGFMALTEITGATQASFNTSARTFSFGSTVLPIADVVRCYNKSTGRWFDSLEQCLVYSNSFTVYYDHTPTTGAKVRVIVAN